MEKQRFAPRHIVAIVVSVCAAVVLAPVGVMAATGTLVNITDPYSSSSKARVGAAGGIYTTQVDPTTKSLAKVDAGKLRVGDGSGNLTVDGSVSTRSLDANGLVYKSPAGGLNCGASSSGVNLGALDLSRYSKLRFAVQSGPSNQTIIELRARAGSEVIRVPWFDWTVPANSYGHTTVDAPATSSDLVVYFCATAKIFVYGIR